MRSLSGFDMGGQQVMVVGVGGIGRVIAEVCASQGADLFLVDLHVPEAVSVELEEKYGRPVRRDKLDIRSSENIAHIVQQSGCIDALILTAGILPDERAMDVLSQAWDQSFTDVFDINVKGPMLLAHLMLSEMKTRSAGKIVLIGSMAGKGGGLLSGMQYAASKGALHTFTRWLSQRAVSHGISVNAIAPGATETDMIASYKVDLARIPAGRQAKPLEIARVATFLASDAASYMSGTVIDVNGGAFLG